MTNVRIPEGFTPATASSIPDNIRLEVLYVPSERDTHFQNGVAKYERDRREGARWRTVDGDSVGDYGLKVLAWRAQQDDLKIVKAEPAPGDREGYDRAIELLAKEHLELELDGARDARPSGVALVAKLFDVGANQVADDYKRVSKELYSKRR